MKIAVTGAFSYSGKYITRRLLERGEEVVTLTGHSNRPDPFAGKVKVCPLNFEDEVELISSLKGVHTFYNTYWVRFDRGENTQPRAVENTRKLVKAAVKAGVQRIVHISITNPSPDSHLPYFWGKAANEQAVIESGIPYAILRPTVLFGTEDILINNIAWLLRRFPFFAIPGNGSYRLQPVFVDDLAELAVDIGYAQDNILWNAVGPDIFTFEEMVRLIARTLGLNRSLLHVPPRLALTAAQFLSIFVGDVMLTPEEVDGLMAGLLVSSEPPRCNTHLGNWLKENKESVGMRYASELKRHY
ncbi:MAG: NAD(P)H-binding protein [Anaerolineales bacterium]|nr:NAD(P)H-binding protein [Anaerolineales bacterium]